MFEWLVQTSGCSGAEITAMCQEAALIAMREDINATFVRATLFSVAPLCESQKFVGLAGRIRRRRESPQATNHT